MLIINNTNRLNKVGGNTLNNIHKNSRKLAANNLRLNYNVTMYYNINS